MTRSKIELYNTSKYQAVFPSPDIAELGSDEAVEVIISADGTEDSASDGLASSITMNASAGVWYDTGIITSYNTIYHTIVTSDTETIHSFNKTKFRTARYNLTVKIANTFAAIDVTIIHDNNSVVVSNTDQISTDSDLPITFSVAIENNNILLKAATTTGAIISGPVNYTAA